MFSIKYVKTYATRKEPNKLYSTHTHTHMAHIVIMLLCHGHFSNPLIFRFARNIQTSERIHSRLNCYTILAIFTRLSVYLCRVVLFWTTQVSYNLHFACLTDILSEISHNCKTTKWKCVARCLLYNFQFWVYTSYGAVSRSKYFLP